MTSGLSYSWPYFSQSETKVVIIKFFSSKEKQNFMKIITKIYKTGWFMICHEVHVVRFMSNKQKIQKFWSEQNVLVKQYAHKHDHVQMWQIYLVTLTSTFIKHIALTLICNSPSKFSLELKFMTMVKDSKRQTNRQINHNMHWIWSQEDFCRIHTFSPETGTEDAYCFWEFTSCFHYPQTEWDYLCCQQKSDDFLFICL